MTSTLVLVGFLAGVAGTTDGGGGASVTAPPFPDLTRSLDLVPKELELKLKGKPVATARWTDRLGLNLLVLTKTARVGEDSGGTQRVHGYQFVRRRGATAWARLWQVNDGVTDCELDLTLELPPASLTITDLDGDQLAETTFAYLASCRGDVSPDALKVLMHEGQQKYALRGSTRIAVGVDDKGRREFHGGERTPDAALAAAGPFLAHAQRVFDQSGGR